MSKIEPEHKFEQRSQTRVALLAFSAFPCETALLSLLRCKFSQTVKSEEKDKQPGRKAETRSSLTTMLKEAKHLYCSLFLTLPQKKHVTDTSSFKLCFRLIAFLLCRKKAPFLKGYPKSRGSPCEFRLTKRVSGNAGRRPKLQRASFSAIRHTSSIPRKLLSTQPLRCSGAPLFLALAL